MPDYDHATPSDRRELEAFLDARLPYAMFARFNLANHGMDGGHPYACDFWIARDGGAICGVIALSEHGVVLPCHHDHAAAAKALAGRSATVVVGPRDLARGWIEAAGLTQTSCTADHDQPHFLLDLVKLTVPTGPGQIVPIADATSSVLRAWFTAYQTEILNTPMPLAAEHGDFAYEQAMRDTSHVVLIENGAPLAMTGFNARLPSIVQVGGVYTPPDLRGRGYARRALGLHLRQARLQGVTQAVLFSASEPASRAYRALGFQQIGDWTLVVFDGTVAIHG